jgi:hypothetical protein
LAEETFERLADIAYRLQVAQECADTLRVLIDDLEMTRIDAAPAKSMLDKLLNTIDTLNWQAERLKQ